MSRPRKPRLYIRPDPFGAYSRCWFGEHGVTTWFLGPVAERTVADVINELLWNVRYG